MSAWSFTIPGRAPSVNHLYVPGAKFGSRRKAPGVEEWQTGVALIVKSARPSGWSPPSGQLRIVYDFYVYLHTDCDNLMKSTNDAIARALGVDDERFLPCARSKTKVKKAETRIIVEIQDADLPHVHQ